MGFEKVQYGPPDVMNDLKLATKADQHPNKVDLGLGVYRNEQGVLHEFTVVKEAKATIARTSPSHNYQIFTGSPEYLVPASKVIFGADALILNEGKVASTQTISGTGAVHLALQFLCRSVPAMPKTVYVGTPTWGNYLPMCTLVGLDVKTYKHYDPATGAVDFESILEAVRTATRGSTFILQACCHNPTATNFTREQWRSLAVEMKTQDLMPLFDIAYQGLGEGLDEDAYGVRHFVEAGFEILVCQSFSKNFALYGERVGVLHIVSKTADIAGAVKDQLRCLIRWEFSSSPAFGSRIVTNVLSSPETEAAWLRNQLFRLLSEVYKTPGDWSPIIRGTGLFAMLPLSRENCLSLRKSHIYLVPTGRVNMSGLTDTNIDYVAQEIDAVVRGG
ncbi:aspartate aminotransferase [Thozetella sp. PMI_491]|nr:aspartate aminotransferase [Thozetella sp. PMI_491]